MKLKIICSCVHAFISGSDLRNEGTHERKKSKFICIFTGSDNTQNLHFQIKGCANSEEHHRRPNRNHPSVIYEAVMAVCGKVSVSTVSEESPPNRKVDRVLLWAVLHGRNSERFLRHNQYSLSRVACMLHGKNIL